MKATLRNSLYSLIVYSTFWSSPAQAEDASSQASGSPFRETAELSFLDSTSPSSVQGDVEENPIEQPPSALPNWGSTSPKPGTASLSAHSSIRGDSLAGRHPSAVGRASIVGRASTLGRATVWGANAGGYASAAAAMAASGANEPIGYAVAAPFGPVLSIEGVFGDGLGYNGSYYSLRSLLPHHVDPGRSLNFAIMNIAVTEEGQGIGNLGAGHRVYVDEIKRIFTVAGWLDFDNGNADNYYRTGFSLESLGKYLDMRLNGYFILGEDKNTVFEGTVGQPFFRSNNIVFNYNRVTQSAYSGGDVEIGGAIPFLGRYGIYGFVGAFFLESDDDEGSGGVMVRVDAALNEDVAVGFHYTNDDIFGSNAWASVAITLPDGQATRWLKPRRVKDRLSSQIVRSGRIHVREHRERTTVNTINLADAQPLFVLHVDPNATIAGSGTVENPFTSFEIARLANTPGADIIRVVPFATGAGTNLTVTAPFQLLNNQRLLSSAEQHTFLSQQGTFALPGFTGGARPLISNSALAASNVLLLADNNEVSGFRIDGTDGGGNIIHRGIMGTNIAGFNINRNNFQNNFEGAVITNSGNGLGIFDANTLLGNANSSNRAFSLTNTNGATLSLLVRNNNVQNYLGEDLNSNGVLDAGEDVNPTNGVLDPGIAFQIIASNNSTINANAPTSTVQPLGFLANTATGNGTGLSLATTTGGTINAAVRNNTFSNNVDPFTGFSATANTGTINLFSFNNNMIMNNGGNGVLLFATNTGTITSLLNEDINDNGVLDAGEDGNANGVLDFGFVGNTITGNGNNGISAIADNGTITNLHIGSVDNSLPSNLVMGALTTPDNTITGNGAATGTGNGISLATLNAGTITGSVVNNAITGNTADGVSVSVNSGSIMLTAFDNNTLTGNSANGVDIETLAAGTFTVPTMQNNNFGNNTAAGIRVTGNTGTANLGILNNNSFSRTTAGTAGILFNTTGVALTAVVTSNQFISDAANANRSFGIGGTVNGGSLTLTVGGADPTTTNTFDANADAGIGIEFLGAATTTLDVRNNIFTRTVNGADPLYAGEGVHFRLRGTAQMLGTSFIDRNVFGDLTNAALGNASHGIAVRAEETSNVLDLLIGNIDGDNNNGNVIANNTGDGINFLRGQNSVMTNVRIIDNTIMNNSDGIDLTSQNANNIDFYDIFDNTITNNTARGLGLRVEADADMNVDLTNNLITNNGSDGIEATEQVNSSTDSRSLAGNWQNNTIMTNAGHGIELSGATSGLIIGSPAGGNPALGNLIDSNALDGVEINGAGTVTFGDNMISNNGTGGAGAGIDFNPATTNTLTLIDNTITRNAGDGLEIVNNSGPFAVTVTGTNNTITFNTGRGVDILNQGALANTTVTLNGNDITGNTMEGVYVVNTASTTQNQTDASTVALASDGALTANPFLTLTMDTNNIDGNGSGSGFSGTGLVIRVGTTDGGVNSFTDDGGFAATRSGIVASVINNTMEGNFGVDVYIESFTSTVAPTTTAGTWDNATFDVTSYSTDPLARLDLTYINNTTNATDANNVGAFYNDAEAVFKSRTDAQLDAGPFTADTRRRNAERQAARNVAAGGVLLTPATPAGASTTFLSPGMGASTFRLSLASDTVPFLLDINPYADINSAMGTAFGAPVLFGELSFGWGRF